MSTGCLYRLGRYKEIKVPKLRPQLAARSRPGEFEKPVKLLHRPMHR